MEDATALTLSTVSTSPPRVDADTVSPLTPGEQEVQHHAVSAQMPTSFLVKKIARADGDATETGQRGGNSKQNAFPS
ncbi:unnamed protein product [Boreogadus saida]